MIKPLKAKDRSMVARMAGNIVGGIMVANHSDQSLMSEVLPDVAKEYAKEAVLVAMAIVQEVDNQIEEGGV